MQIKKDIFTSIKNSVLAVEPDATIILYGSYARGDNKSDSDIDILVLLDKDKLTPEDKIKVSYPLYDIEFETSQIINPLVLSKSDWKKRHKITPFYENVNKEGITL